MVHAPVLFVADIRRALALRDLLGFEKAWHEGDGTGKCAKSIVRV